MYNLPTFRLDALVIFRAKVKRGAKMLKLYRRQEKPPLVVIPYVSGVSERIRKACEKFNLKANQARLSAHCSPG